jgi:hypothetical protein
LRDCSIAWIVLAKGSESVAEFNAKESESLAMDQDRDMIKKSFPIFINELLNLLENTITSDT